MRRQMIALVGYARIHGSCSAVRWKVARLSSRGRGFLAKKNRQYFEGFAESSPKKLLVRFFGITVDLHVKIDDRMSEVTRI